MRSNRGLRMLGWFLIGLGLALAAEAAIAGGFPSQLDALVTRVPPSTVNGRPYQVNVFFFTADGPAAVINLGRAVGNCPNVLDPEECITDADCSEGECEDPHDSPTQAPDPCSPGECICRVPVDVHIDYVAVFHSSHYCAAAACAGVQPPGCTPTACNGSGNCGNPQANAVALCLCPTDPCRAANIPDIPAQSMSFEETFEEIPGGSILIDGWALHQAIVEEHTVDMLDSMTLVLKELLLPDWSATAFGQIRLTTMNPGDTYVLVVKWTIDSDDGDHACSPYANLSVSLETGPAWCAQ